MTKKVTTILCSVMAIVVCAAVILITVLYLQKEAGGFSHFHSGGMNLSLTRESLYTKGFDEQGRRKETTDNNAVDFTGLTAQNVFGLTGDTMMLPGCAFSAQMAISGNSEKTEPFAYWLGIQFNGEVNEFAKQLLITVTVDGGESVSRYLSETLTIGSESQPLAKVTDKTSSSFTVRVEFDRNATDGGNAQNELAVFDLVVYAVKII